MGILGGQASDYTGAVRRARFRNGVGTTVAAAV